MRLGWKSEKNYLNESYRLGSHQIDDFTRQYLETALWSSTDESTPGGGEPLDRNYGIEDFADEAVKKAIDDCEKFQEKNAGLLSGIDDEQAGHDFWLTRNHHGAGFWDRGHPEDIGEKLTQASHQFGELNVVIGDDGKLYLE